MCESIALLSHLSSCLVFKNIHSGQIISSSILSAQYCVALNFRCGDKHLCLFDVGVL